MKIVTILFGDKSIEVKAANGKLLGDVITSVDLPVEQPCAGRGTCGRCKIMIEKGGNPPDEIEQEHLSPSEINIGTRLACRALVEGDTQLVLSPIEVFSNKVFKASSRHRRDKDVPLGLAIDLGSTTVGAYLTMMDTGEVVAGGASLNQQRVYGADVIARLSSAILKEEHSDRLHRLAIASIYQAIDSLKLSEKLLARIERVTIVGNTAMHHLLLRKPIYTLAMMPFQPSFTDAIWNQEGLLDGIFDKRVQVMIPPVIGGFVGSDALACIAAFDFENATGPTLAVDMGTNGEVLLTDGETIVVASTAAGPAFEGVDISCGMRAVDGAIVDAVMNGENWEFETIGDEPPIGITGSGLVKIISELVNVGIIERSGRITDEPLVMKTSVERRNGIKTIYLTPERDVWLTQKDIRELQKAKGAIRAAIEILMTTLNVKAKDLEKILLTGSFGGQLDIESVITIGMLPIVSPEIVENSPNGAGMGAAIFLTDEGFKLGERLAAKAIQVDLDQSADFHNVFVDALHFVSKEDFS